MGPGFRRDDAFMKDDNRPDPDLLLSRIAAEEGRARRGEVKIFFGSVAGSGKTYAMLEEAHARLVEGIDVVAGVVETHGRTETKRMLEGIPILPSKSVDHRDVTVPEFDLDAALARKPRILLLDELAHTNAPGSRHPKRWQDLEELLNAGIDVYTTLNVQHLESLSDVVAEATGIWVKETVPDSVFDSADDIELIDLPADEILKRLKDGKIYIAPGANIRAADNFFRKANLITLREIALRRTAERVDAQRGAYHDQEGIKSAAPIAEKIIACINTDPVSAKVVRSARRMASSLKAPWTALYIETDRQFLVGERGRQRVQGFLRMAERLGGRSMIIQANNQAEEILAFARKEGATKIVVGKSRLSYGRALFLNTLADRLIHRQDNIDIYVIAGRSQEDDLKDVKDWKSLRDIPFGKYVWSIVVLVFCTLFGMAFQSILSPSDQAFVYLIGNIVAAANFGRGPAVLYALLSATCFNFFFVPPLYSLQIYDRSYWLTLFGLLFTGLVITSYASRLQMQAMFSRKREYESQMLYAMTRDLAAARGLSEISAIAARHIGELSNADAAVWLRNGEGYLERIAGSLQHGDPVKETSVLQWVYNNHDVAGMGTSTMPSSAVFYVPLTIAGQTGGVLGVKPKIKDKSFTQDEMALFQTFASLLTSALERTQAGDAAEKARIEAERERMRSVLLSSVSHDLRTPLASITGASSSILEDEGRMPPEMIRDLTRSIHQEAGRLSRLVANLLDVTSLEAGGIAPNRQPYFLDELIGSVLAGLEDVLATHEVRTHLAPNLPMALIDPILLEQVFANLMENAAKYTPDGSRIEIDVSRKGREILVAISDNGPGIPAGAEKVIFDKFFTIGNKISSKGTGLGLSICSAIIKAHGGVITAENRREGGARFLFTVPVADVLPETMEAEE
jgi:two-component system sensor histidine kinase KdpD